jgi:hypothetical protein
MVDLAFEEFPKIPRLKREVVITEKVDGANGQITFFELADEALLSAATADPFCLRVIPGATDGDTALGLYVGSRNRWCRPEKGLDNFGIASWVLDNLEDLIKLGPGRHFGEWYGLGIQRGYDLPNKRFALFNVARWNPQNPNKPTCCEVVPILARGEQIDDDAVMQALNDEGSVMVPGYRHPEGIIVFHTASRQMYKRTFAQDGGKWKGATVRQVPASVLVATGDFA